MTWVVFLSLLGFGVLNAGLGPALPYVRAAEHISYLGSVLPQVAFAVGGGSAGLLAARMKRGPGRTSVICVGLGGAAVAWLVVGYGDTLALTAAAALLVSLLGTSALIRLWAVLADIHGPRRSVAMSEGEVSVSLGGILAPLLIGALAATALSWRFAFVVGTVIVVLVVAVCATGRLPAATGEPWISAGPSIAGSRRRLSPALVMVFAVVALEFSLAFWLASYLADDVGVARRLAATMVSGLYAANLAGRLLASRFARHMATERILAVAITLSLAGLPVLLTATNPATATFGLASVGIGVGATFPLTSSLHVKASARNADGAIGQVLATAAIGQIFGPLAVAVIAQAFSLRSGLLTLPLLALLAAGALRAQTLRTNRRHSCATPGGSR